MASSSEMQHMSHMKLITNQCKKNLSVYNTVQGRHISHSFKTAKIIVFDPMLCKSPDVPLQDELLC